jgi:hypothetical protein
MSIECVFVIELNPCPCLPDEEARFGIFQYRSRTSCRVDAHKLLDAVASPKSYGFDPMKLFFLDPTPRSEHGQRRRKISNIGETA